MIFLLQRGVTTNLIFLGNQHISEKGFEKVELDWGSADSSCIDHWNANSGRFGGARASNSGSIWNLRKIRAIWPSH